MHLDGIKFKEENLYKIFKDWHIAVREQYFQVPIDDFNKYASVIVHPESNAMKCFKSVKIATPLQLELRVASGSTAIKSLEI